MTQIESTRKFGPTKIAHVYMPSTSHTLGNSVPELPRPHHPAGRAALTSLHRVVHSLSIYWTPVLETLSAYVEAPASWLSRFSSRRQAIKKISKSLLCQTVLSATGLEEGVQEGGGHRVSWGPEKPENGFCRK